VICGSHLSAPVAPARTCPHLSAPAWYAFPVAVRLDVWLDVACLFKTRSEAQKACRLGKVSVNGAPAKAHRDLKAGDELTISRPLGRRQLIEVLGVAEAHLPKAEARLLYRDTTPAPSAEEVEMRRLERLYRATSLSAARPTRDQRRARRRLAGKD
jgi:ribosome-associated heat shock protein Hsp15